MEALIIGISSDSGILVDFRVSVGPLVDYMRLVRKSVCCSVLTTWFIHI